METTTLEPCAPAAADTRNPLAYTVYDGDEHTVIVFARSSAEARRKGANEMGSDWSGVESCRRAPRFDQYAPGPVPDRALFDDGWRFECFHCDEPVSQDEPHDYRHDAEGFLRDPAEFGFYERGGLVFCCQECMASHAAWKRQEAAREVATVEAVALRWPMAANIRPGRFSDHSTRPSTERAAAYFRLPGIQDPVKWFVGAEDVLVTVRTQHDFIRLYGKQDDGAALAERGGA
jgi:hypothetical protein